MSSSQVGIASFSSPFARVFKDHSRRDQHRCRDQNSNPNFKSQLNFQRNFKELVRDHLNSCISTSPTKSSSDSLSNNDNSHHHQSTGGFSCCNRSSSNTIRGGGGGGGGGGDNGGSNKTGKRDLDENPMPTISRRQSWVLDRWAARQARDTMTTIKRQNLDAESLAMSMRSSSIAASPSPSDRDPSPLHSDASSNDLSVSSLVQKWRGYENQNHNHNQTLNNHNHIQPSGTGAVLSRASSVSATSTENSSSIEACETSTAEKFYSVSSYNYGEESESVVGDSEPDRPTLNRECDRVSSAPCGGDAGGGLGEEGERERMRVVDIIRKWTSTTRQRGGRTGSNDNENEPHPVALPQLARVVEKGGDHNGAFPVICSPRVRGRQAIADLFMNMEKERRKEIEGLTARQAVTKFAQRGRIQSMLRLRFLRHDAVEDQWRHHPKACGLNRSQHKSYITHLRKRFNEASDQRGNTNPKSLPRVTSNDNLDMGKASTSDHPTEEMTSCEENSHGQVDVVWETRQVEINHEESSREHMKVEVAINHAEVSDEQTNHKQVNYQEQNSEESINGTLEESSSLLHPAEDIQVENVPSDAVSQNIRSGACNVDSQESGVYMETSSYNEMEEDLIYEEEEDSNQQFVEANLDWINDVSRARSYWEDCRRSRYKEVFESTSANEEIRQLIEWRSVSVALTSAFRQRMDQLLMSCMQRRVHALDNEEYEDQSVGVLLQGHTESLGGHEEQQYEEQMDHEEEWHEEEGEEELAHDEDEEQTPSYGSYHHNDDSDYFDHEDSEDSEQMGCTHFQGSSATNYHGLVTQEGSSLKNVPSIEMGIIYGLRTHMEQLRHEMSELRRTLKGCMDMQMKIRKAVTKDSSSALGHSEREEKRVGSKKAQKKGNCCICCAKKVDSLLYKCGHMCTCFDCASELQWSSRKCPICQAEIVDVVRAYPKT